MNNKRTRHVSWICSICGLEVLASGLRYNHKTKEWERGRGGKLCFFSLIPYEHFCKFKENINSSNFTLRGE